MEVTLGLLDLEESEDICDECCETALDFSLDPQDIELNRLVGVDSRRGALTGGT